jgi:hypothetical protein
LIERSAITPVHRTGVFEIESQLIDVVGAEQLLREQLPGAVVAGLQLAQLSLALRRLQCGARGIETDQDLAGPDLLPDLGHDLEGDARGLGDHLRFAAGFERGRAGITGGDGPTGDGDGLDRNRFLGLAVLVFGLGLLAAGFAAGQNETCEQDT